MTLSLTRNGANRFSSLNKSFPPAVEGALIALSRCRDLVLEVGWEGYILRPQGQSSIGEHTRHIVDHYASVLAGVQSGIVNYESRDRGGRLEQDFELCLATLDGIAKELSEIRAEILNRRVEVVQIATLDREPCVFASSLDRELAFLSGHTIHHLSTMLLVARLAGIEVPCELGMAFSTQAAQSETGLKD